MGCSVSLVGPNLSTRVVLSTASSPKESNETRGIFTNSYPRQRSAIMKKKIKNKFFSSLNDTGLSSWLVKNQELPSQTSITADNTRTKVWRNLTGKSNKKVKLISCELDSCDNMENKRTVSDIQSYDGRISASLSKLSVHEQGSLPNSTYEFSVVYLSDFNSNLSDLDFSNQECADVSTNGLIRREIPTSVLMQNCDAVKHVTDKDIPLSLEAGEIALAVHQEFFNDFGDICDDDFLFSG